MSNLRSLLGTKDINVSGIYSGGIGRLRPGQTTYFGVHDCGADSTAASAFNSQFYCCWRVPGSPTGTGTTVVTFEVWGGGGGGAGACCCMIGVPAGAGAYARKTVTGIASGTAYDICIGTIGCRTPDAVGTRGCKSYVTGSGLSNFCADGGYAGCSLCALQHDSRIYHFKTALGGAASGCCQGLYTGCNDIVGFSTFSNFCVGCCAQYFGADFGAYGLPGAIQLCAWGACRVKNKLYIAYPGGLVNEQGGYINISMYCDNSCGYREQCCAATLIGFGAGNSSSYVPGVGGVSAWTCAADTCCCGSGGYAGAARITVQWV
jgi:hypothetical protein